MRIIVRVLLGPKVQLVKVIVQKHIDLRQHFVHDAVQAKTLKLEVVASTDNVADILTKPLTQAPFQLLHKRLLGQTYLASGCKTGMRG